MAHRGPTKWRRGAPAEVEPHEPTAATFRQRRNAQSRDGTDVISGTHSVTVVKT